MGLPLDPAFLLYRAQLMENVSWDLRSCRLIIPIDLLLETIPPTHVVPEWKLHAWRSGAIIY